MEMLHLLKNNEILTNQRYKFSTTKFVKILLDIVKILVKCHFIAHWKWQKFEKINQYLPCRFNKDLTGNSRKEKTKRIVAFQFSYSDSTQNSNLAYNMSCKYTEIAAICPYQGPCSFNLVIPLTHTWTYQSQKNKTKYKLDPGIHYLMKNLNKRL